MHKDCGRVCLHGLLSFFHSLIDSWLSSSHRSARSGVISGKLGGIPSSLVQKVSAQSVMCQSWLRRLRADWLGRLDGHVPPNWDLLCGQPSSVRRLRAHIVARLATWSAVRHAETLDYRCRARNLIHGPI